MAELNHGASAPEKIDLFALTRRFAKSLRRHSFLSVVLIVLMAGLFCVCRHRTYRPICRCSAVFAVGVEPCADTTAAADEATARTLAAAFPALLQTDLMQDLLREQLKRSIIPAALEAKHLAGTPMVELTVTGSKVQETADTFYAVLAAYPHAAKHMARDPYIYIQEQPTLTTASVDPSFLVRSALAGASVGFLLACAVAAVSAMLSDTASDADQLQRMTGLRVFAALPHRAVAGTEPPLRDLAIRVRRELTHRGGKTVLFTGTLRGEGATTASVCLARTLAQEGARVVLLDADLRTQGLAALVARSAYGGLLELSAEPEQPLEPFLVPFCGFWCISGAPTRRRLHALDSSAIARVLARLGEKFDYIILDAAPCTVNADTVMFSRHADAVVYTVRADRLTRNRILNGVVLLAAHGAPAAGVVLTGSAEKRAKRLKYASPKLKLSHRIYGIFKHLTDILLSLGALAVLALPMLLIAAAIKLDDGGPVFFRQKRIGRGRKPFEMLKFRTMRSDSPHTTPTHLLRDPARHITRVGRFLRRTSLDELPQIFNILRGEMSLVGPRPALWSQFDLIDLRDRHGVNALLPGVTGWAQINGRDELEIEEKVAFDAQYLRRFGPWMDIRCFFGTFRTVLTGRGIAEGRRK